MKRPILQELGVLEKPLLDLDVNVLPSVRQQIFGADLDGRPASWRGEALELEEDSQVVEHRVVLRRNAVRDGPWSWLRGTGLKATAAVSAVEVAHGGEGGNGSLERASIFFWERGL